MPVKNNIRVILGLSGGVDSAVAALLLKQQGFTLEAVYMENWEEENEQYYCNSAEDFQDARQVCEQLDIPLHKVNFAADYRERVFSHFLDAYASGRTPNPDVMCNTEIKFQCFLGYAQRLGAQLIATGHYARKREAVNGMQLLRAADCGKDQSYFLHGISQNALCNSLFPIGDLHKHEVRKLARDAGFTNHAKKDSTGICFIGERKFSSFLASYLPAQPGDIVTPEGEHLGMHQGLMFYTLGQRHGLGIGGRKKSSGKPWYVAAKNLQRNVLVVVQDRDHPLLLQRSVLAFNPHWISGQAPGALFSCTAKSRYRQADQDCQVRMLDDRHCRVEFMHAQRALTPGQYVVFYSGQECLGGAVIGQVGEQANSASPDTATRARNAA